MNDVTILTEKDLDDFVEKLQKSEIKIEKCLKCSKEYFDSYGHMIGECDNCYFKRFPKEEVKKFCRSFFN